MGEVAALISAVTWACTSVLLTTLTARTPPIVISALRLSAACCVLPFILLASGQASGIADASAWTIFSVIASGVVGYGIGDTVYIHVLGMIGLQRAFPISMALFISLTVVGGIVLLGEPFKWGLPVGALLIGAGVYLIVIPGRRGGPGTTATIEAAEPALAALPAFDGGGMAVATAPAPTASATMAAVPAASPWLAYGLLVLVGLLWATATLWLAGADDNLGAIAAGSMRTPAGAVALVSFGMATMPRAMKAPFSDRRQLGGIIAAGLLGTAFGSLMYVYAVVEAGAARTAVLSATAPLMGLPLSIIFLGERFTRRIGLATVLCVAGILLVVA